MCVITGTDACALPVLTPAEAHASKNFDQSFPAAHPPLLGFRSSDTRKKVSGEIILVAGTHTQDVLEEIKLTEAEKQRLALDGALGEEERLRAARSHKL